MIAIAVVRIIDCRRGMGSVAAAGIIFGTVRASLAVHLRHRGREDLHLDIAAVRIPVIDAAG